MSASNTTFSRLSNASFDRSRKRKKTLLITVILLLPIVLVILISGITYALWKHEINSSIHTGNIELDRLRAHFGSTDYTRNWAKLERLKFTQTQFERTILSHSSVIKRNNQFLHDCKPTTNENCSYGSKIDSKPIKTTLSFNSSDIKYSNCIENYPNGEVSPIDLLNNYEALLRYQHDNLRIQIVNLKFNTSAPSLHNYLTSESLVANDIESNNTKISTLEYELVASTKKLECTKKLVSIATGRLDSKISELRASIDKMTKDIDGRYKLHSNLTRHNLSEQVGSINSQLSDLINREYANYTNWTINIENPMHGRIRNIMTFPECEASAKNKETHIDENLLRDIEQLIGFFEFLNLHSKSQENHTSHIPFSIGLTVQGGYDIRNATLCKKFNRNYSLANARAEILKSYLVNLILSRMICTNKSDSGQSDLLNNIFIKRVNELYTSCPSETTPSTDHNCVSQYAESDRAAGVLWKIEETSELNSINTENTYKRLTDFLVEGRQPQC